MLNALAPEPTDSDAERLIASTDVVIYVKQASALRHTAYIPEPTDLDAERLIASADVVIYVKRVSERSAPNTSVLS